MNKGARYQGICEQCGAPTYAHYKSQLPRFCSFKCSNQWKWDNVRPKAEYVEMKCAYCGKIFKIISCDSRLKKGQSNFYCSKECSDKGKIKDASKICPICGKLHKGKGVCCSTECGSISRVISQYNLHHNTNFTTIDECRQHRKDNQRKRISKKQSSESKKEKKRIRNAVRRKNPEYREKMKLYLKDYAKSHKEDRRLKQKERLQKDPLFRFKTQARKMLCNAFTRRNFKKNTKTEKMLGCSLAFFAEYIQSKFKEGMTLENYGEWQLDHIIPLATANTIEDVVRLNHYTNFQPLWAKENREKSDKIL